MRRHLILLLASVKVHHLHRVQGQLGKGVDGHTEQAGIGVNKPVDIPVMSEKLIINNYEDLI